jgi:hypothetical protein
MARLTASDWREIQTFVTRLLAQQGEAFVQGVVVKNDPVQKLVWLKEFGDQPIPLISFDFQVKYYYENAAGQTQTRKTVPNSREVEILTPRVGETVLVAKHMGSRRLPKCLGVIKSTGYVRAAGGVE